MNGLNKAIYGALESLSSVKHVTGLWVEIDNFDFKVSFGRNIGFQLMNSHEAIQLVELDILGMTDLLDRIIRQLEREWQDTLMADYELELEQRDPNYHAMNSIKNWV